MEGERRKRRQYSLREKWNIITEITNGGNKSEVEKKYDIRPTTLWNMLNQRKQIRRQMQEASEPQRKRMRRGEHKDLEIYLYKWFLKMRCRNIPIGGPTLCKKAKHFASTLGLHSFTASTGWLFRFRRRFGITKEEMYGEQRTVSPENPVSTWNQDEVQCILARYPLDDIYNVDEMGLLYQLMPDKCKEAIGDCCRFGKLSKERLTVLFCCNSSGKDKMIPLVVGKYKHPFNSCSEDSMPCCYKANVRSWITNNIFRDWLVAFDNCMKKENRHIVLLIHNSVAHRSIPEMKNVKVLCFPESSSDRMRPMKQGIMRFVKTIYRFRIMQVLRTQIEMDKELQISLLDAVTIIAMSWMNIPDNFIANCWQKAKILNFLETYDYTGELEPPGIQELWEEMVSFLNVPPEVTLEDYISADDDVFVASEFTQETIVDRVKALHCLDRQSSEDESEDSECDDSMNVQGMVQDYGDDRGGLSE